MKLILTLLLFIPFAGFCQQTDLTGIWQDSPSVGSGWSDTYQFFKGGTVIFNYNQMICDKRTISYKGNWEIDNKGSLIITIIHKTIIEGGKLVPATGSCASEFEIEGGKVKTVTPDTPEKISIKLSEHKQDNEDRETIKMNGIQFWRMNINPDNY
jgi:hypothetical protein